MPDPRAPGTDQTGPIGPVAALVGSVRRSGAGNRPGVAAVSAATGRYAFLDLPGFPARGTCGGRDLLCALSPDGRTVAYWTRSGTTGHLTGLAAYDTVTSTTRLIHVPGLIGKSDSLTWISADTLLLRWSGPNSSGLQMPVFTSPVMLWSPGHGGLRTSKDAPYEEVVAADPPGVTMFGQEGLALLPRDAAFVAERRPVSGLTPQQRERVTGAVVAPGRGHPDRRGSPVAFVVGDRRGTSGRLYLGRLGLRGGLALRLAVTALHPGRILGWRDRTHVVVDGVSHGVVGAFSVDAATGRTVRLVTLAGPVAGTLYASDLWRRPTAHRRSGSGAAADARPFVAGAAVGAAALAGAVIVRGRRRVRS